MYPSEQRSMKFINGYHLNNSLNDLGARSSEKGWENLITNLKAVMCAVDFYYFLWSLHVLPKSNRFMQLSQESDKIRACLYYPTYPGLNEA